MLELKDKILLELKSMFNSVKISYSEQDEYFWYFNNDSIRYRVYKMFNRIKQKLYHFTVQEYLFNSDSWEKDIVISVQSELADENT